MDSRINPVNHGPLVNGVGSGPSQRQSQDEGRAFKRALEGDAKKQDSENSEADKKHRPRLLHIEGEDEGGLIDLIG